MLIIYLCTIYYNCTDPDASEIAWRALDLMFPHDFYDDYWSDWSGQEEGESDVDDDGQVIEGNIETDCPGSQFSL